VSAGDDGRAEEKGEGSAGEGVEPAAAPLLVRLLARPPRIPRRRRRREIPHLRDGGECRPPATPALSTLRCCSGVSAGAAR